MGKNRSHGFDDWGKVFEYSENTNDYFAATANVNSDPNVQRNTGYNQTDLANVVGLKSRASEILNRKRKLSLEMIRQIHDRLNIPTEVLIQAY